MSYLKELIKSKDKFLRFNLNQYNLEFKEGSINQFIGEYKSGKTYILKEIFKSCLENNLYSVFISNSYNEFELYNKNYGYFIQNFDESLILKILKEDFDIYLFDDLYENFNNINFAVDYKKFLEKIYQNIYNTKKLVFYTSPLTSIKIDNETFDKCPLGGTSHYSFISSIYTVKNNKLEIFYKL